MSKIADVYSNLYTIEKSIEKCKSIRPVTKGGLLGTEAVNMSRFSSAKLTRSYNHVQSARMYAGSICRMFGVITPYTASFKGELKKEKNEVLDNVEKVLDLDLLVKESLIANPTMNAEAICLSELRRNLAFHPEKAGAFYEVLNMVDNLRAVATKKEEVNPIELDFHIQQLLANIQDACNLMGLRYGELIEQN